MSSRWQYQVLEIKPGMMGGFKQDVVQDALQRQGQSGWELLQVVSNGPLTALLAVFKRPT